MRLLVAEDLYEAPEDGFHHELVHGLLVSEPLAGGRHGMVAAAVHKQARDGNVPAPTAVNHL